MQDRLELFPRSGFAEDQGAHPVAVERPRPGGIISAPKAVQIIPMAAPPGAAEFMRDVVGVDHRGPVPGEQLRDGAFPAADAAREADRVRHQKNWYR